MLAGLAFNGAIQPNFFTETDGFSFSDTIYAGVFSTLIQLAMLTSFLSKVVSTLASQYGPSLALTGKSSKIVVYGSTASHCLSLPQLLNVIPILTLLLSVCLSLCACLSLVQRCGACRRCRSTPSGWRRLPSYSSSQRSRPTGESRVVQLLVPVCPYVCLAIVLSICLLFDCGMH